MCKKCPYSELFWTVLSRIRTEYGRENTDQTISEYRHFSRNDILTKNEIPNTIVLEFNVAITNGNFIVILCTP